MASGDKHPYSVRKQASGRSGSVKYIVVLRSSGQRVTTVANVTRETAQAECDALNIGSMVRDWTCDPRPYHVRLAEAKAEYEAGE